ncbi:MFS transporter small subunit [Rhodococcus spongiicola]
MTNTKPATAAKPEHGSGHPVNRGLIALAWLTVTVPFVYGLSQLCATASHLFGY